MKINNSVSRARCECNDSIVFVGIPHRHRSCIHVKTVDRRSTTKRFCTVDRKGISYHNIFVTDQQFKYDVFNPRILRRANRQRVPVPILPMRTAVTDFFHSIRRYFRYIRYGIFVLEFFLPKHTDRHVKIESRYPKKKNNFGKLKTKKKTIFFSFYRLKITRR